MRILTNTLLEGTILVLPLYLLIRIIYLLTNKRRKSNLQDINSGINRINEVVKQDINYPREILFALLVIYLWAVLNITIFPINFSRDSIFRELAINIIPFKDIIADFIQTTASNNFKDPYFPLKLLIRNLGGNFLLLFPLGVILPLLWNKFSKLKNTILACFLVSLSIEFLQGILTFTGLIFRRAVDVDDLILNTLGGAVGYLFYLLIIKIMPLRRKALP
ncbi:VanZ family protein [Clostridium polynesiense]|uniref:VanZ family protein n=1 Tax=Clostridium polynesiense TaxID=1325933 RepID=UPI000693F0BA|nr:VanZ family protein [Clostridium polynesiense]